jgi:hypothetical protein
LNEDTEILEKKSTPKSSISREALERIHEVRVIRARG